VDEQQQSVDEQPQLVDEQQQSVDEQQQSVDEQPQLVDEQQQLVDEQQQLEQSDEEKPGFIFSTVKYIGSSVFGFLFDQYLNVLHSILETAQRQMLTLVPGDSPTMDKYQQAQLMNAAINAAFQDPRVQESLKAFQQNIKDVIQPFLAELTELFEKEGETLEKSAVKVVDKIARNSVNMAYNSALAAVESVPGVGTIMSLLSVLQGAVDTVSTVSSEGMKAYTMFMKSFLRVVGETSGPIVDTVNNANKLFKGVTDVRNELAENLAKISDPVDFNQPVVTDVNQNQPVVTDVNQNQPVVTDVNQNQPVVTDVNQNQPVVTDVNQNQPVVTDVNQNQPVVTDVNQNQPGVTGGRRKKKTIKRR
jgi:phage-related protein